MCSICAALNPTDLDASVDTHAPLGANLVSWGGLGDGGGSGGLGGGGGGGGGGLGGGNSGGGLGDGGGTIALATLDALASHLVKGFWEFNGEEKRSFTLDANREVTVNLSSLDGFETQNLARAALSAWTDAAGIKFIETFGDAQITFDDEDEGAYSSSNISGTAIVSSFVNVAKDWDADPKSINSYWFQTYLHEIGHAIGLGHAGNYNGGASYASDHKFNNDSWQASVMSYFSQTENPNTGASYAYTATAMAADLIAIQAIYGKNFETHAGDTVYGNNSNVEGYLGDLFDQALGGASPTTDTYISNPVTLTIFDTGGIDTLDLSSITLTQRIDLNSEAKSDVAGFKGNIIIARGTVIENAIGGSGRDSIYGNSATNTLEGGASSDLLDGRAGRDTLIGGSGNDTLIGGTASDLLIGGTGADKFYGGTETDTVSYASSTTDLVVDYYKQSLNAGDAAGDTYSQVEIVIGGSGNDVIRGGTYAKSFYGMDGNDKLSGRGGDDRLRGGNNEDTLSGSGGNDYLDGGLGNDLMTGGSGSDTFVFNGGFDVFVDFTNNIDTILVARSLVGDITVEQVLAFAALEVDKIVFHFSDTDTLTLNNFTSIGALLNDLVLV